MVVVRLSGISGQYLLEGFNNNTGIDIGCDVRVSVGPGLCRFQGGELGDHQAAAETGFAGIFTVDSGMRAGQHQPAFGEQ